MKKSAIAGVVVGLHVLVVGSLFLVQGCGTTPTPTPTPETSKPVVMPPPMEPAPLPQPVVEQPKPVMPRESEMETKNYTVKAGDSLSLIGKRFNVTTRDLLKLNKLSNPNKIRVGQKILLPAYADMNAPEPPHKHKPAAVKHGESGPVVASGDEYVVKAGDSLSLIAKHHGTTSKALREVNSITGDKIRVGQKLKLPKGGAAAPAEGVAPAPAVTQEQATPGAPAESVGAPLPPMPGPNEIIHVVEAGQDLSSIAMMYGVHAEDIIKLNSLTNGQVSVGQSLKMPPPPEL